MKTVVTTNYICECCGQQFVNEEMCQKHEAEHAKVEGVTLPLTVGFEHPYKHYKKYPEVVDVRMSDGADIRYGILDENKSIAER